eukprot:scaffold938_cov334-Pavlova_lutheri.AAC.85
MHSCDAWIGLNLHGLKVYLFLDDREVILERDAKELTAFMLAVQCINTHFCSNLARPATHMKYPDCMVAGTNTLDLDLTGLFLYWLPKLATSLQYRFAGCECE